RDLGLIDMKGRMYDPLAGRFTTPDPLMQAPFFSQGMNRYSYVFNNPVNNVDPSGFEATGFVNQFGTMSDQETTYFGEAIPGYGGYADFGGANIGAASGSSAGSSVASTVGSVLGVVGGVINFAQDLITGLPGQGSVGGQFFAAPSAAPSSAARARGGV